MDKTVIEAEAYLALKYDFDLLILYGSFASHLNNAESDIDIIGFGGIPSFVHESAIIDGHMLDAWIYPCEEKKDISKTLHILPCTILIDKNNTGNELVRRIEEERRRLTKKMTDEEKEQTNSWIRKMINRASRDSPEGDYRYNWLLYDFPELYCNYLSIYYDGPIKTLKNRIAHDAEVNGLYTELLKRQKDIRKIEALYNIIMSRDV